MEYRGARRLPRRKAPIKRQATVANIRVSHTWPTSPRRQRTKNPGRFHGRGRVVRGVRYANFANFSVEPSIVKPQSL